MQQPRFIFLAIDIRGPGVHRDTTEEVHWMIVSANNRQLGRSAATYPTHGECRTAVARLRADHQRAEPVVGTLGAAGRWTWRLDLDGEPVAVSSRSYLRMRECQYNLERFLEAVAAAEIANGVRVNRADRRATADSGRLAPAAADALRGPRVSGR